MMRRGRELAGLAIGIAAGLGIALAWLVPARGHSPGPAAAASSDRPFGISGLAGGPAVLDGGVGRVLRPFDLRRLGRAGTGCPRSG